MSRSEVGRNISMMSDYMRSEIYSSCLEHDIVCRSLDFGSCYVEIEMRSNGFVSTALVHEDSGHSSPLLEKMITDAMPDWSEVERKAERDSLDEQEFRDYLERNSRYW